MLRKLFLLLTFCAGLSLLTACSKDDPDNPSEDKDPGTTVNPVGTINGHEYVDLGLPSGLKWATCNVGATSPEEFGDYFAWGETQPKSSYTENNSVNYGNGNIGDFSGNATFDAARALWGNSWRMPTSNEFKELFDNCTWVKSALKGSNGYLVTGPNGNQIFLPAAGYRERTSLCNCGYSGNYWSSTPYKSQYGYDLLFYPYDSKKMYFDHNENRFCGQSIRAVSD